MAAHLALDAIWQRGYMERDEAYRWLAKEMGLSEHECHLSRMKKYQLMMVRDMSRAKIKQLRAEKFGSSK